MEKRDLPWLEELSLNKEDFSKIPEGEHPLPWAFKNDFLKEEAYVLWASSYYKVPAIKAEFFSLAVDFTLIEKFSKLHQWNSTCYPIYYWEDTLFVACLEPVELPKKQKVCFAISPFSAMTMAWNKHFGYSENSVIDAPNELPPIDLTIDEFPQTTQQLKAPAEPSSQNSSSDKDKDLSFNFDDLTSGSQDAATPPAPKENKPEASLEDLDFSTLHGVEAQDLSSVAPSGPSLDDKTKVDTDINTFTSATETIHLGNNKLKEEQDLPDAPFGELSFDKLGLEPVDEKTASDIPPIPKSTEQAPNLSELNQKPDNVRPELETIDSPEFPPLVNDDYTPLPVLAKVDKSPTGLSLNTSTSETPVSEANTVTDLRISALIPNEYLITDEEASQSANLDQISDRKSVMAHIFHHLKRDYKRLMWVEFSTNNQYFPKYCYGNWSMSARAWNSHVNLSQPNIFKIAHTSNLPFHGEISDNPFNDKYYELWLKNKKPDFATIFPTSYDEYCYGFIVGFSKGPEFNDIDSLKKIENLVSICKKPFLNTSVKKAS